MKFGAIWGKCVQAFHESFIEEDEVNQGSQRAKEGVWVHEQGLGDEQSMLEWWKWPILARIALLKKSDFHQERERERRPSLGGQWWAWRGAIEGQGPWLACPEILAPMVEARVVCVLEIFLSGSFSMKA